MGIRQQANGQHLGGGTFTVALPAPSLAANRVAVLIAGNTTVATPSGWSLRTSQVNWMGHYLWDRAGGATSWAFTASGQLIWWVVEIDAGAYINALSANSTSEADTYVTPSITPTAGDRTLLASIGSTTDRGVVRTVTNWTGSFAEQIDSGIAAADYPMQAGAIRDVTANGSTAYSTTATFSALTGGRSAIIAAYATTTGGAAHTGSGTLSADATITGTGTPGMSGTGTLTGDATLTAAGSATWTTTQTMPADGAITSTGIPHTTASLPMVGDGGLTGAGSATQAGAGAAELTGAGAITGTSGTMTIDATTTIAGTGEATSTALVGMSGTGTADGTGTLTAAGASIAASSGALTGTGTLDGTGTPTASGAAALTGDGGLIGVGVATAAGAGTGVLAADGALTGLGTAGPLTGTTTLTGDGGVTGTGTTQLAGTVTLTGDGTITGSGIARQSGYATATLDGAGTITAAGTRNVEPPTHPGFGLRVACYDIDGPLRGRARGMLVERYARAGEAGRLKVGFSKLAPRSELFTAPVEIAVEYLAADGTTWVEPEDGRYVIAQDDHERTADPTGSHDLSLLGIAHRLNAAKVLTAPPGDIQTDGKRQFLSRTPGQIIGTLLAEAKSRGAFPTLIAGFTNTHDSAGNPWQLVYNRAYELNHSLLGILQNLYDGGAVDYWVEGQPPPAGSTTPARILHMVPAGTRGRDLTEGLDPVYLRDRYAAASPERDDWTKLANHVVLIGDEGAVWEKTNPTAYAPFGRQETVILAGGVSNEATATLMMDRALAEGADVARQLTREWQWAPGIRWMPDRDIRVGDWVLADTAAGTRQRVRVADLMTRQGPDGIEAFITLGTVHDDLQTRMAKRQIGIEGGAGVGSIGRPTPKPPPDPTNQWGARPQGFTVAVSAWPIPGGYGGVFGAAWQEVTTDSQGFAFEPDGYVVRGRKQGHAWQEMMRTTSLTGQVERSDMRPGDTWEAEVAAYRNDRTGVFSAGWSGQVPEDTQAPPAPSQPTGDSPASELVIGWDGLTADGGAMPLDLKTVEVSLNGATDPEKWKIGITGGSLRLDTQTGPFAIGDTVEVRLRAIDWAGNASDWSTQIWVVISEVARWPDAPTDLIGTASAYMTPDGFYRGLIDASWGAVTTATDGDPIDVTGYVVRARRTQGQFPTIWFDIIATSETSGQGSSELMHVGDTWEIGVAATSKDHTGPFSNIVELVIPPDEIPPPTPSRPIVTSSRALLTVEWDGLNSAGGGMPPDLWYLTVHITGLTETWQIDPVTRIVHISGLNIGTAYEVRLSATDYADNTSPQLSQPADPVTLKSVMDDTDWQALMAKATSYGDNLYPDALYAEPGRNQIREQYGWTLTQDEGRATPTAPVTGEERTLWLTPTGSTDSNVALMPGDTYQLGWRVQTQASVATNITVVRALDGQAPIAMHAPIAQAAASDQAWTYTITAQAGYRYGIRVTSGPTVYVAALRKRVTATLIEDGAVIADKLAVNHAMAAKFSGILGDFDTVFAGVIQADMLSTTALDFKTATGLSLTAPNIQSTVEPNRGLKLTATHKRVYNATGVMTVSEDYTTGDIQIVGGVRSSGAYPRFELVGGDGFGAGWAGIQWLSNPGWARNARIVTNSTLSGSYLPGSLFLEGGQWHGLTMQPVITLQSGYMQGAEERFWPSINLMLGANQNFRGWIRLSDAGEAKTSIDMFADFMQLTARSGAQIKFPATGTVNDMTFQAADMGFIPSTGGFRIWNLAQRGGSWEVHMDGSATLVVVASERRLKLDPRDVPLIPQLLNLQPVTFIDRAEKERNPNFDTRDAGVIAEQAEQVIASVPLEHREFAQTLVKMWHPPTPPGWDEPPGPPVRTVQYSQIWTLYLPIIRALWEEVFGPIPDGKEPDG